VNKLPPHTFKSAALRAAAVFAVLIATGEMSLAQGPPPGMGAPGNISPKEAMDAQTRREAILRSAGKRTASAEVNPQQLAAAIEQTKNDFKRIQLLRNELVERLVAHKPLDYKQLTTQAEEINKRANRLKSFLIKSAPEEEKSEEKKTEVRPPEYDEAGMQTALIKLCNTIYSFTGNPMFTNLAVVGAGEPAKAGGELLTIIELSENIKRNAERLAKTSK
jgi:hypothetical protein